MSKQYTRKPKKPHYLGELYYIKPAIGISPDSKREAKIRLRGRWLRVQATEHDLKSMRAEIPHILHEYAKYYKECKGAPLGFCEWEEKELYKLIQQMHARGRKIGLRRGAK